MIADDDSIDDVLRAAVFGRDEGAGGLARRIVEGLPVPTDPRSRWALNGSEVEAAAFAAVADEPSGGAARSAGGRASRGNDAAVDEEGRWSP